MSPLVHLVLLLFSGGYAKPQGKLSLSYAPVCHGISEDIPLDLHASNTPPAFILSQDQTLSKKTY